MPGFPKDTVGWRYNQGVNANPGHHRKSLRIQAYDYSHAGAYYVTIVTHGRVPLFGEIQDGQMRLAERGLIAQECWRAIPAHFPHVELGIFVVMPNHVHGILILHDPGAATGPPPVGATQWVAPTPLLGTKRPTGPKRGSIGAIIGAYKMSVTRQIIGRFGGTSVTWQRNYYDHIIRNDRDHQNIHNYILANPLNWEIDDENRS